jgi:hypothetical protein
MKLTYEVILNDPSLLERIERQAHRERAAAVHELILNPLSAGVARLLKGPGHAARPHLARQG